MTGTAASAAPLKVTREYLTALGTMYRIPNPDGLGERMVRAGLWVMVPDCHNNIERGIDE